MEYLIRFVQAHESFRRPEIDALSTLAGVRCEVVSYAEDSPFCVVRASKPVLRAEALVTGASTTTTTTTTVTPTSTAADTGAGFGAGAGTWDDTMRDFESRAVLSKCIYEVWGQGRDYDQLRADVERRSRHLWDTYKQVSFKFSVDSYGSTRDTAQQRQLIDSFRYLGLAGKIKMKNPDVEFAVLEEWLPLESAQGDGTDDLTTAPTIDTIARTRLNRVFLGRKVGDSCRRLTHKHDLKRRPYISTTSMDAELALVTANMALASPGKIFLDPFVGTGGFLVAAAELGAVVLGSDIDGRSFRGKSLGLEKGVGANFERYGLSDLFGDCIISDLTNTPFRSSVNATHSSGSRWLDGIVCDPPYGVREGLKVLGTRRIVPQSSGADGEALPLADTSDPPPVPLVNGIPAHMAPGYVAPKKPYSFLRMLDDILAFASRTLVDGGRLAFWMPSANENELGEEETIAIPTHPHLELKHQCVQRFYRWSRRLLVFERLPGLLDSDQVVSQVNGGRAEVDSMGRTADELNPFRRRYFQPAADRSDN